MTSIRAAVGDLRRPLRWLLAVGWCIAVLNIVANLAEPPIEADRLPWNFVALVLYPLICIVWLRSTTPKGVYPSATAAEFGRAAEAMRTPLDTETRDEQHSGRGFVFWAIALPIVALAAGAVLLLAVYG